MKRNPTKTVGGFNITNFRIATNEHRLLIDKEFAIKGKKSSIKIVGQSRPGTPEEITGLYNSINTFRDVKHFFNTQPYNRDWYM